MEEITAASFEGLYRAVKNLPLRELHRDVMSAVKKITGFDPPEATEDYTDRDYLETAIEAVIFIHCIIYGVDYTTFNENAEELGKLRKKNKLLKYMLDLKFELFGKEIFDELGMEIVERVENGLIVIDKNKYS